MTTIHVVSAEKTDDKHMFLMVIKDNGKIKTQFPMEKSDIRHLIEYLDNKIHH